MKPGPAHHSNTRARFGMVRRSDRRLARQFLGRTDARVVELDRRDRALGPDRGRQARQAGQVIVGEDAQLPWELLADPLDVRCTGHH